MNQEIIDQFLQKDINVLFNKKIIRKGKLILYTSKDFYISLIIKTNKDINKTFDIPYPFNMELDEEQSQIIFDYRLDILSLKNPKKLDILEKAVYNNSTDVSTSTNTSKYLGNVLYIRSSEI
jgi:hypothetical protein